MLWTRYLDHLRISPLKSLRGNQVTRNAFAWSLTLGIALDALAQTSLGFHRFEPVIGIVSPLPWAILLTRQGISLGHVIDFAEVFTSLEIKAILLTLHVAMQIGLYLHRIEFGVWHVVSEDSDHFSARFTVIHCLHDLNDLQQPTWSEVRIRSDDLHARYESLEVEALRGAQ